MFTRILVIARLHTSDQYVLDVRCIWLAEILDRKHSKAFTDKFIERIAEHEEVTQFIERNPLYVITAEVWQGNNVRSLNFKYVTRIQHEGDRNA